jgi:hypothetical protein
MWDPRLRTWTIHAYIDYAVSIERHLEQMVSPGLGIVLTAETHAMFAIGRCSMSRG